jgi:hypothetical protein
MGKRAAAAATFAAALLAALLTLPAAAPAGPAAPAQPQQPSSGPGGSDYPHAAMRVSSGGAGADAWFAFEPAKPRPAKAPLTIVTHGYYEFSGYDSMDGFIRHTVRQGSIVIYPRWQTGVAAPCPGPFDIEPCIASEVAGIKGALEHLRAERDSVRPQLRKTSYFGFSFGGIITANIANRFKPLGLPKPRAIFLDDPHDGGLAGLGEPALDDSLDGIPRSTLLQCHSGADGVIAGPDTPVDPPADPDETKKHGSCNSVFPLLTSIPRHNKDLVLTHTDRHGSPPLSSAHGVCTANAGSPANAYDWNFCWKVWDALRSCALEHRSCRSALGDTRKHRSMGEWSDGVPIAPLKIRERAPIRP